MHIQNEVLTHVTIQITFSVDDSNVVHTELDILNILAYMAESGEP